MLHDLAIQNYRCFKDFQIEGLTQVNLIVGPNNSGKTSLLEAFYLLGEQLDPQGLVEILEYRGEVGESFTGVRDQMSRSQSHQITHLFHGHQLQSGQEIRFQSHKDRFLKLELALLAYGETGLSEIYPRPAFGLLCILHTDPVNHEETRF
jgi:recombinational DNA repair ATPase RecF